MNEDEILRRARVHVGVMYHQYLYWSSYSHLEKDRRPHLAFEWDRKAMAYRNRALDAVWITTGKWTDND